MHTIMLGDEAVAVDPNLPTLNIRLLARHIEWAAANSRVIAKPEAFTGWPHWNQGTWLDLDWSETGKPVDICQSFACIAGNIAIQAREWVVDADFEDMRYPKGDERRTRVRDEARSGSSYSTMMIPVIRMGDGYVRDASRDANSPRDVAREALGLTEAEADALFSGSNKLVQLVWLAKHMAARRGQVLVLPSDIEDWFDTALEERTSVRWEFNHADPVRDPYVTTNDYDL